MNMLPCAQLCRHQKDGYCQLKGTPQIQHLSCACPYFVSVKDAVPLPQNRLNGLRETADSDQVDLGFKI